MRNLQLKPLSLQQRLDALSLTSKGDEARQVADRVLLGKMMTTRVFSRRDLVQIITNVWRTNEKVRVERLNDFLFKFYFESKGDRDKIFGRRPWSFNGAHLNLKLWDLDIHFERVSFDTSTFFLQIHGLPPSLLHADNARLIGSEVGQVHEDSISRRTVVNQRYLRLRVDIPVGEALPAGFVQRSGDGDEYWVQFKYERLADFCYKCGFIDHVTGRCKFKEPARVTMGSGVSAKLYGPWLRAEEKGSLLFVNPATDTTERQNLIGSVMAISGDNGVESKTYLLGESSTRDGADHKSYLFGESNRCDGIEEAVWTGLEALPGKDDSEACFQNALEMSPEVEALAVTTKRQALVREQDLKEAVLNQLRKNDVEKAQLGEWATEFLKVIATAKEFENSKYNSFGPAVREWLGTGPAQFSPPSGPRNSLMLLEPITHSKRQAQVTLENHDKKARLFPLDCAEAEDSEVSSLISGLQAVEVVEGVSDGEETPIHFQMGESTPIQVSRRRSWKKDARKRGQQQRFSNTTIRQGTNVESQEGPSSSQPQQGFLRAEEAGPVMPPPHP